MNNLEKACLQSHEHWINNIEESISDTPNMPENQKFVQGIENPKRFKNKKVLKMALIAALISSVFIFVIAYRPANQFTITPMDWANYFQASFDKFSQVEDIYIKNLSKDYTIAENKKSIATIITTYVSDNKNFTVHKTTANTNFYVSNSYIDLTIYTKNNVEYRLYNFKNNTSIVVWLTDSNAYRIRSYGLTNDELIEISKNTK